MRTDLLRLSVQALTQLSNAGLLKRAQRELAGDYCPSLSEAADGAVSAQFPDGVQCVFAPGAGLREARCSCGAGQCRHRIALVLAYQQRHAQTELAVAVSPGSLDDAALRSAVGEQSFAGAQRLLRSGVVVEVQRAQAGAAACAKLPNATVLFHAGCDLSFARCDCVAAERCLHVVLAVWAFRAADAEDGAAAQLRIELRAEALPSHSAAASELGASAALSAWWQSLLLHGLRDGVQRHAAPLANLRDGAQRMGATWLLLTLEALENWLAQHAQRSARFVLSDGVTLCAELLARSRAAAGNGEVSAAQALGIGEPLETALGRTRLLALGTRIVAEGAQRSAQVVLLDPDTGTLMGLPCSWQQAPDLDTAAALALAQGTRIAAAASLSALSHGQIVTTVARRRANGELKLGASHGGRLSLSAQHGRWQELPGALICRDLGTWLQQRRHLPPALLRPRRGFEDFLVLEISTLDMLAYDPVQQLLFANARDPSGTPLQLVRSFESANPGALHAMAATLGKSQEGAPLLVAGRLKLGGAWPELEPWAFAGSSLVIPDLSAPDGSLAQVELAVSRQSESPLSAGIAELQSLLADLLLHGRDARAQLRERADGLRKRLAALGLTALAARLQDLLQADASEAYAGHWTELALRVSLLREHGSTISAAPSARVPRCPQPEDIASTPLVHVRSALVRSLPSCK